MLYSKKLFNTKATNLYVAVKRYSIITNLIFVAPLNMLIKISLVPWCFNEKVIDLYINSR